MPGIVDVHAYWDPGHLSLTALCERMARHGVARAILSPPCTIGREPDKSESMYRLQRVLLRRRMLRGLAELASATFYNPQGELRSLWRRYSAGQPLRKVVEPDNAALASAIAPYPELDAWYWINPARMPEASTVREALQHPRVAGVKLHAYWHRVAPTQARAAFRLAAKAHVPVYLILGFGWLAELPALLTEYASVPVILGYGGFPYFEDAWTSIARRPQVSIDFASNHLDAAIIGDALRRLGPSRCLYGSDCPYNFKGADGLFEYAPTIDRVARQLDADGREAVFHGNAGRLLTRDATPGGTAIKLAGAIIR